MYLHGHFYNQKEERIEVHVLTGGDRTKEIVIGEKNGELSFTDDPVDLTSQVNDTFDHLLCQQATVRLLARNFVPDFFCASCRDAVVNIYREGKCLFAGFIEPQSYSQGYNEEFDVIELSCIDALTALQYAKYRDVGSLGVLYNVVKAEAEQRTFLAMLKEILGGVTAELDIVGGNAMRYLYDGSKAVDDLAGNRYAIFGQLTVSELLFLGDEEDDVWQQDEVLEEILKYLNLHIVQDGFTFYLFSWESVKGDERIYWRDLLTGASVTTARQTTDIVTGLVTDTDTKISVGEVYNKIMLTAKVESMESVIESPLDNDLLKSPYSNKQKYMTEYSSDGEGSRALNAFDAMTHGQETSYSGGCVTDWYVQMMNNSQWLFPKSGGANLMEEYCSEGRNQHILPNWLAKNQGAAIIALGKVEKKTDGKDNSPTSKVEMTNYLVVSVNGNCDDKEATTYPNTNSLKAGIPRAVYNGSMTGGVFSPTDEGTTNYIVLSGKLVLNPVMALTDTYKAIYNYDGGIWGNNPLFSGIKKWLGMTVPSRNNGAAEKYWGCFLFHSILYLCIMNMLEQLARLVLPKEILDNFDIVKIETDESDIDAMSMTIHLDERMNAYLQKSEDYESKGFMDAVRITDFPIRDHKVILVLRRRRWKNKETGETFVDRISVTESGTRYSKEFAAFLKETYGHIPDDLPYA